MTSTRSAVFAAGSASAAMIAFQVGGKATRDALFLSNFQLTFLPAMVIASSLLSVIAVLWAVRRMSRHGPWRFIPALFATSTVLLFLEWAVLTRFPGVAAILLYLHYTVMGALLVSGFWSMVNERFDPRTAKRQIGRIGAAGTAGGIVGGLLAASMASMFSIELMLPLLGALHLVATLSVQNLRASRPPKAAPPQQQQGPSTLAGVRLLGSVPYLRNLVVLVVVCTVAEGLIDFVFKGQATLSYGTGEELLRLFAGFYTGVALLTFLVQGAFARIVLERFGLAGAVSSLPATVALTGTGALFFPGLPTAALARGSEAVLHNSLFRSGYELLFTPIHRDEKRATKTLVDVGAVRFGDVLGGGIIQAFILVLPGHAFGPLLGVAVLLSVAGVVTARLLKAGYRQALEKTLIAQGITLDTSSSFETMEHPSVMETVTAFDLRQLRGTDGFDLDEAQPEPAAAEDPITSPGAEDPLTRRIQELRSGDKARVRAALTQRPVTPLIAAHVIPLLAWDEVARAAAESLRPIAHQIVGQLLDAMLDPDREFTVRRRIPGILIAAPSERAVEGLLDGLGDRRFEVRYRAGKALVELHRLRPDLGLSERRVYDAVLREVMVDRQIWESQRLLDELEDQSETPFLDDFLRDRAGRSMEHVFTILSLALPSAPLKVAFRGLYTDDDLLRGTSLEYLETALPDRVRDKLWPFLEDRRPRRPSSREREEIIADLMRSNDSISLNLEEIRRRVSRSDGDQ